MRADSAEQYSETWKWHVREMTCLALDSGTEEDIAEFERLRDSFYALIDRATAKVFGPKKPAATGD